MGGCLYLGLARGKQHQQQKLKLSQQMKQQRKLYGLHVYSVNSIQLKQTPFLQVDNSAAVRLAQNPEFYRRTKHIAIKHFFIREKNAEDMFDIQQI